MSFIKKRIKNLGEYIKIDITYLLKGNFWLGLGTIIGSLISFLLVLAFGNFLAPEEYGTYKFLLSYASIFGLFALGGFNASTVRSIAKGFDGDFMNSFIKKVKGSLIGAFVAIVFSIYYFTKDNSMLGWGFLIIGLALPLFESLLLYNAILSGRKEFKLSSLISISSQIFASLLLLGAILLKFEALELLITYFVGWTIARLFFFLYVTRKFKLSSETSEESHELGKHLTLMGILNQISSYLDKIILFHSFGAAEVAIYSFAIAPTEQAKGLFKNINALALPRFSERSEKELKDTMKRKMIIFALAVSAFVVPFIILAPWLFQVFLPKYQSSVLFARIFAISLFGVMVNLPVAAMKSLSKIKELYIYNTTLSVLNIGLIITLTSLYGVLGTILARLITRLSGIALSLVILYRS